MRAPWQVTKPRSSSGERGFALSEVLIAILIVGAALLTLLAASASSFSLQEIARQRQTAVGIANKVMEEARALSYSTLRAGTYSGASTQSADPEHVADCGGEQRLRNFDSSDPCAQGDGLGEILVTTAAGAVDCPDGKQFSSLPSDTTQPLLPNCTKYLVSNLEYRAFVFITQAQAQIDLYRISVIVNWPYVAGQLATSASRVVLQSMFGQNAGCLGKLIDSLLPGPCGNGSQTSLTLPAPQITVAYDGAHTVQVRLGELQLVWDEPSSGERSIEAEFIAPAAVVNGTNVPLGVVSGSTVLQRDNVPDTTDIGSTGPSQYVGVALDAAGGLPLTMLSGQLDASHWLVMTWRHTPAPYNTSCPGGSLPQGTTAWFACAELDIEATGDTCFVNTPGPCVGARLYLPAISVCVVTSKGADCPSSPDRKQPEIWSLSGAGDVTSDVDGAMISGVLQWDAANKKVVVANSSLKGQLGVGYASALASQLSYSSNSLLKYVATTDWASLALYGQKMTAKGNSADSKLSGCFKLKDSAPSGDLQTVFQKNYLSSCYYSTRDASGQAFAEGGYAFGAEGAVTDASTNLWHVDWTWRTCAAKNNTWAITTCPLVLTAPGTSPPVSLKLDILMGIPSQPPPTNGVGW